MNSELDHDTAILTVSQLNQLAKLHIESLLNNIWIEGEISNFSAPSSGHWYFSLKDEYCQIRAAMFRTRQKNLLFTPENGMHVLVRAKASIYEQRGDFQLIVDDIEERGEGKLIRLFEQLKQKLAARGWFSAEHKKPLPLYPNTIGVISSPTGAAVHDVLTVLQRRYPLGNVIIYPCLVQGKEAASSITNAIHIANQRNECDVLIVCRGGGSLEDLWAFNEEPVASAIHHSSIPIVSGVGHEIDITIADFVADVRAATPSAAAELTTPDLNTILGTLHQQRHIALRKIQYLFQQQQQKLLLLEKHHLSLHPKNQLNHFKHKLTHQYQQLQQIILRKIQMLTSQVSMYSEKIDALSPLKTLSRGYCLAYDDQHQLIKSKKQVAVGAHIEVQMHDAKLRCQVDEIKMK